MDVWLANICLSLAGVVNGPPVSVRLAMQVSLASRSSGEHSWNQGLVNHKPFPLQKCRERKSVGAVIGATCGLKKGFK